MEVLVEGYCHHGHSATMLLHVVVGRRLDLLVDCLESQCVVMIVLEYQIVNFAVGDAKGMTF
jgi:hypothetical protein